MPSRLLEVIGWLRQGSACHSPPILFSSFFKGLNCYLWFSSYVQTYLERDIRSITNVRDLSTFRWFLALVASRHGQMLNKTDLAAPLGVSIPTIGEWLNLLELTGQIILVPPYFENFGKRIVKSPKLYLVDSGLVCHLLGIRSYDELNRSPFLGAIFEGFVAAEILKSQVNKGAKRDLSFSRPTRAGGGFRGTLGRWRRVMDDRVQGRQNHSPSNGELVARSPARNGAEVRAGGGGPSIRRWGTIHSRHYTRCGGRERAHPSTGSLQRRSTTKDKLTRCRIRNGGAAEGDGTRVAQGVGLRFGRLSACPTQP